MQSFADNYNLTLFLRIFMVIFGLVGAPVALLSGGFTILLFWVALGSLVISLPIFIFITLSGNSFVNFLMGLGGKEDSTKRFSSDLLKAQHSLRESRLEEAENLLDLLLIEAPDHGEALLLRAQVMMKAQDEEGARRDLEHILRVCDKSDLARKWALGYLREMNGLYQATDKNAVSSLDS